jgi:hypothetical protein
VESGLALGGGDSSTLGAVPDAEDRPMRRTRLPGADLGAAWREHAPEFIAWDVRAR